MANKRLHKARYSKNARHFLIKDIDCVMTVEIALNYKGIFDFLDDMIDNAGYDWYESDDSFEILYKDGTVESVTLDDIRNGVKVKRQHILSMVYKNDCTDIVYGNFHINWFGVVHAASYEYIDSNNIQEVTQC